MSRRFCLLLAILGLAAARQATAADAATDSSNPHYKQAQQDLDTNNFTGAAEEYEAALASDPKLAGAHYELGVLYAEKLSQPISAIYHLERFLKLAPSSDHAPAAREMVATESEAFAASLPGSSSSAAMARLQIENSGLKKQVADAGRTISQLQGQLAARPNVTPVATEPGTGSGTPMIATSTPPGPAIGSSPVPSGSVAATPAVGTTPGATTPATATSAADLSAGARTYTVVKGDKIWTIAKRMYPGHTKEGVEKIQEANKDTLGTKPLKIGQVLIIPQ